MGEPKVDIDVLFVGHTGVGKSSLINMIRCIRDTRSSPAAAEVSNDARPCTQNTIPYPMQLASETEIGVVLHCQLWDTRGLDEAVDNPDRWLWAKIIDRIRQRASQQERELKETIRDRTRTASKPILMWCINASKIDVPFHWQQFCKVYMEYCDKKAIPVVVITRMAHSMTAWEPRCRSQLQSVGLGDVTLLRVREHRNPSSAEWTEDSNALRNLIFRLMRPDQ